MTTITGMATTTIIRIIIMTTITRDMTTGTMTTRDMITAARRGPRRRRGCTGIIMTKTTARPTSRGGRGRRCG